ncbi:MAG: hypothetical protein JST70_12040 [Bacteroidetes bacterium]|nr:hypothetical protein [Bacteroidota bacterium]
MRKLSLLLILFAGLCSCDCSKYTKNIVADSKTHEGIPNVMVYSVAATGGNQTEEKTIYTDSTGSFEASFSVSGIAKCPTLKLTISKPDYDTRRITEPQPGDTIFLTKLN